MEKLPKSSGSTTDDPVSASITFLAHFKLNRKQDLLDIMRQEGAKDRPNLKAVYDSMIFKNRVEFSLPRNSQKGVKKPSIKKLNYCDVERTLPDKSALKIVLGYKQGKTLNVLSFGFCETTGFLLFLNALTKSRGWSMEPWMLEPSTSTAESRGESYTEVGSASTLSNIPQRNSFRHQTSANSSEPALKGCSTSYVLWEEDSEVDLMSTDMHMASRGHRQQVNMAEEEEEEEDETNESDEPVANRNCPCCYRRGVIKKTLKPNPRAVKQKMSANNCPHCAHSLAPKPRNPQRAHLESPNALTSEFSDTKEARRLMDFFNMKPSTIYPSNRQRHYPTRGSSRGYISHPIPLQPLREPDYKKIKFRSRSYSKPRREFSEPQTPLPSTEIADSSSGYTSDNTYQASEIELTVETKMPNEYIRNKKILVTGKMSREQPSQKTQPPRLFYRRSQSGKPRLENF